MKSAKTTKNIVWESTDTACLLRNKHSRKYYGRFTLWGKQKWVNLNTNVLTVAKLRLPTQVVKMEKLRALGPDVQGTNANMGELMEIYLKRSRANSDLKLASVVSRETAVKKIKKTWPGLERLSPKVITPEEVQKWANAFKRDGTRFAVPNTKTVRKGNSASSVNRSIDVLRRIFEIAVEFGQLHTNPVSVKPPEGQGRLKKKVLRTKIIPPSNDETKKILEALRVAGRHGGWGVEAFFLCSFLLLSGARIGESRLSIWKHVDWTKKTIFLPGYKTEAAPRTIPLFPELEHILRKLIDWRRSTTRHSPDKASFLETKDRIFRIGECQKSIDAACELAGVKRITHHDFRHLFATRAIEAGVDFKTIAEWLGHADGGVLVMQTYGHLRQDHSQESAKKIPSLGLLT